MKKFKKVILGIIVILLGIGIHAFVVTKKKPVGTNYYFNNSIGNDGNTGTIISPWKTLTKFNSIFASKSPGDNFLFNRGDTFMGVMTITRSGLSGSPITISAYGTGANPVLTTLNNVGGWTNIGGNIWESSIQTPSLVNMVLIGGTNYAMGRVPNTGYFTINSAVTNTTITSTALATLPNWTGAEVVMRKTNWITERAPVVGQSGNTITYTSASGGNGVAGMGFFIQNDKRTLDTTNEWFYNKTTKKLDIYSLSSPTSVQIPTRDTLVAMGSRDFITFDGVDFVGSNKFSFICPGSSNLTIQNCNFNFAGRDVLWGAQNFGANSATLFNFNHNTVNHTNNNVITFAQEFTSAQIDHNTFLNTGMQAGMAMDGSDGSYGTMEVMQLKAANSIVEYNVFDSVGYIPVNTIGDNDQIRDNFITHFNMTKFDGGGIYSWNGITGATIHFGVKIYNNIIVDAPGTTAMAGTLVTSNPLSHGIYRDANTMNEEIYNNFIALNGGNSGIYNYSGSSHNNYHNNIVFGNGATQVLVTNQFANGLAIVHDTFANNQFISRVSTQLTGKFTSSGLSKTFFDSLGVLSNNYYARPVDDNQTIQLIIGSTGNNFTLGQWKTASSNDVGSQKSPITITDVTLFDVEYNATESTIARALPYKYQDILGNIYNGTVTLTPYTGVVLIKIGNITGGRTPNINDYNINHNNLPH